MEEELKEIKADIRSVLTTSKLNLSVKDLQRDYLSLNGRPINYRKLGFSSIIELLLSFNDIVTVSYLYIILSQFITTNNLNIVFEF